MIDRWQKKLLPLKSTPGVWQLLFEGKTRRNRLGLSAYELKQRAYQIQLGNVQGITAGDYEAEVRKRSDKSAALYARYVGKDAK